MPVNVLFLVPYPPKSAPSQRFRVELFEPVLQGNGIHYEIKSFLDRKTWDILFKDGHYFSKVSGILKGYLRRFKHILHARRFDYVFIHREAAPLGPPVFEWLLSKVFRKKIIYDFDDAIWIQNISAANRAAAWLKAYWKVKYICKWSYKTAGGNDFLRNYAAQFARQAVVLPTCVDMERKHNLVKDHHTGKPVIGWTGSHSTLHFLDRILPVIKSLQEKYAFRFLVIADKNPGLDLKDWEFIPWNESTEIKDLIKMDIGIMPAVQDAWSEGKCGFKLIQYLSLGIPAVADAVGVNKKIIEHEKNGFLSHHFSDWEQYLEILISSPETRKAFGLNGRAKMLREYSLQSQSEAFISLLE